MRIFLVLMTILAVVAIFLTLWFYIKNDHAPESVILKVITPTLGAFLWVWATSLEHKREEVAYYSGLALFTKDEKPFNTVNYTLFKSDDLYFQEILPNPQEENVNPEKNQENIIKAGLFLSILKLSYGGWSGYKSKISAFNFTSTTSRQSVKSRDIDIKFIFDELGVKIEEDIETNLNMPLSSIIGIPTIASPATFVIETEQMKFTITLEIKGSGSISKLGADTNSDIYKLFKFAERTGQVEKNSFINSVNFTIKTRKEVKFLTQWSEETRLQELWIDSLSENLKSIIEWDTIKKDYLEFIDKGFKKINVTSNYSNIDELNEYTIIPEKRNIPKIYSFLKKKSDFEEISKNDSSISITVDHDGLAVLKFYCDSLKIPLKDSDENYVLTYNLPQPPIDILLPRMVMRT